MVESPFTDNTCISKASQEWNQVAESLDGSDAGVLPEEDLEEEHGESGGEQHEEVRHLRCIRFPLE